MARPKNLLWSINSIIFRQILFLIFKNFFDNLNFSILIINIQFRINIANIKFLWFFKLLVKMIEFEENKSLSVWDWLRFRSDFLLHEARKNCDFGGGNKAHCVVAQRSTFPLISRRTKVQFIQNPKVKAFLILQALNSSILKLSVIYVRQTRGSLYWLLYFRWLIPRRQWK